MFRIVIEMGEWIDVFARKKKRKTGGGDRQVGGGRSCEGAGGSGKMEEVGHAFEGCRDRGWLKRKENHCMDASKGDAEKASGNKSAKGQRKGNEVTKKGL